jgi:hypothetical protein
MNIVKELYPFNRVNYRIGYYEDSIRRYKRFFLHCLTGPAIEYENGSNCYFLHGKRFKSEKEYISHLKYINF